MLPKIILIVTERILVLLSLAILRDSETFVSQLVYILLIDAFVPVFIILLVDFCVPWLRTVRVSLERNARLVVMHDDDVEVLA